MVKKVAKATRKITEQTVSLLELGQEEIVKYYSVILRNTIVKQISVD